MKPLLSDALKTAQTPILKPSRPLGFSFRISEFLLVLRLRMRRRSILSADILERALRMVQVTCLHWFGLASQSERKPQQYDPHG